MNKPCRIIDKRLFTEVCDDFYFFGIIGALLGCLNLVQVSLKERGVASGDSWPVEVFSSFFSFSAFFFIFLGLLVIGPIATLINVFGYQFPKLEDLVAHVERRFIQLTSMLLAFTWGLLFVVFLRFVLLRFVWNATADDIPFALKIVRFDLLVLCASASATLAAGPDRRRNNWKLALFWLLFAIGIFIWLILLGR
jgi:hypothetical protein